MRSEKKMNQKYLEIDWKSKYFNYSDLLLLKCLFSRNWFRELEKAEVRRKEKKPEYSPSLLKAILRTFGPHYAFLGIFTFLEEGIIRIFQPLFMGK